ncbi:glucose-1-phosphate adenylyltransferase [Sporobacter termitidis DSM 10068]|uniref:Glucose-1-phosphate adenylyltransferase n=1 Tax=Sporobacter termitidis DSM 10068 TaxID=1123282 RepID=A0A1M5YNC8_9FIRM|nr:glucose-1-phosphate adenylyltransferase [Sporobacter termitidis]SHI13502.1 glucose-1-phosphate adenylyltransferase [Sporobacter termitidis DSM 10068]
MRKKECLAMLLAGGQGSRLGVLTKKKAKPAVVFGGKYRIIDFSLSNCVNSGIDTVGVLTQYKPLILNAYIGTGEAWDLDVASGGVHLLAPAYTETGGSWYKGTADAIYQNIDFIDSYDPEHVLILSGDHLYKMDYSAMLAFHKKNGADLTISVIEVPWEEAGRFGVMSADENMRITEFAEKPSKPKSNLASMGIYIFKWDMLRRVLTSDHNDDASEKDFGKDVIPAMLRRKRQVFAYRFSGYWKDVGTIDSYYEAQMGLLVEEPDFNIFERDMRVFSNSNIYPPHYIGLTGVVKGSLICNGCTILGEVRRSILSSDVYVGAGALVDASILLPGARVEEGAQVVRAIVGEGAVIGKGACFCGGTAKIAVLGDGERCQAG